jgi:hypothetical protein
MKLLAVTIAAAVVALSAPALGADGPIDTLAGVYKTQFKNGNISGDKYDSEDILEIVKVSPTAAYVRTHLEFFNGHVCNIQGVADVEDGALVYRAREKNVQGNLCVLGVRLVRGRVTLQDQEGHCAIGTCGNRGMYNGTTFDLKRKRPIRYMEVLIKSEQYKDAVKDHDERAPR